MIAARLIEAGVDPGKVNCGDENVLHLLHSVDEKEVASLAELLVKNGANCSQVSKENTAK